MDGVSETATKQERHLFLVSAARENYDALLDYEFKGYSVFMIVFGWVATSSESREILSGSLGLRALAIFVISCFLFAHIWWLRSIYITAIATGQRLRTLGYSPEEDSIHRRIDWKLVALFGMVHVLLSVSLASIIWSFGG